VEVAGSDEFRRALAPTIGAVRELTDAISERPGGYGHEPTVSSRAMEEIAVEEMFAKRAIDWDRPIEDTHSFGGMSLLAATDYARSFATLLDAEATPVYGHLVLARSVLEACVIAAWLNDPKVDATERVKRGLCEQLYSAMELVRLRLEEHDAAGGRDGWKACAKNLGWSVDTRNPKPAVDGTRRPSVSKGIAKLLTDGDEAESGRVLWGYLSAVSHVAWHGIAQALSPGAGPSLDPAHELASVGTHSTSAQTQALCVLIALRKAAQSRFVLMGWADNDWHTVCERIQQHELVLRAREGA
jgi:hypothetical protein